MKLPKGGGKTRIWVQKGKNFKSVDEGDVPEGAKKLDGKPLPDQGVHVARLYAIYDIGTQHVNFTTKQGKTIDKWQHKIYMFWELPSYRCYMQTKDEEVLNRPLSINKEYTLSAHVKSNLIKDLTSWKGSEHIEAEGFEVNSLISDICMLNIDRKRSSSGRDRAEVAGIMPIPEGMNEPEAENDPVTFFFEEDFDWQNGDTQPPEHIPSWIAKKILACKELQDRVQADEAIEQEYSEPADEIEEDLDEQIPF